MDHSDPPSTASMGGGAGGGGRSGKSKGVTAAATDFRLQVDYHWSRSLSERVRGMRDSALGVVWKKRREQKLREIEVRDACQWLLAAGFPQYVQMYQEHQCPINVEQLVADHCALDSNYLQPVLRRINILNNLAVNNKPDVSIQVKVIDSDDCDLQVALSDKWIFRPTPASTATTLPTGGRWAHRDIADDRLLIQSSSSNNQSQRTTLVLPDADSKSSSCGMDSPLLPHRQRHNNPSPSPSRSSPTNGERNSFIEKESSSCGDEGDKSSRRRHRRRNQRERSPQMFSNSLMLPEAEFRRTDQGASADKSPFRGARSLLKRGVEGLIGRRSASTSSQNRKQATNGRPEIGEPILMTSSALDAKMEKLGCVDLDTTTSSGVQQQQQRTQSSDSLVGVLRSALISSTTTDSGVSSPVTMDSSTSTTSHSRPACSKCTNGGVVTICENGSAINGSSTSCKCDGESSQSAWAKYFDDFFCDAFEAPVGVSAGREVVQDGRDGRDGSRQTELDQLLDELNRNITLLDETLEQPDDSSSCQLLHLSVTSCRHLLPADDSNIDWDYKAPPVSHSQSNERTASSEEPNEVRERRDSGVGFSLTRPSLRVSRVIDTVADKSNSTTRCEQQLNHLTVGELIILRKLCLLHITSLIETYSPLHQAGTNWCVPRPNSDGEGRGRRRNVFGAALGWSTCSQRRGQTFPPGSLPLPPCILDAMDCLLRSASEAVGIFRKSGVRSRIQRLRDDIEADPDYSAGDFDNLPVYDVADMLKLYFHELPDCLLTDRLSETCTCIFTHVPVECRLVALQSILTLLPDENRDALHCLLLFLYHLAEYSTENQMTASNLAICFAPSLFHVYGLRSQSPANGPASSSPRRDGSAKHSTTTSSTGNGSGLPDESELVEQKAAHECLTTMIANVNQLFVIPEDLTSMHSLFISQLMQPSSTPAAHVSSTVPAVTASIPNSALRAPAPTGHQVPGHSPGHSPGLLPGPNPTSVPTPAASEPLVPGVHPSAPAINSSEDLKHVHCLVDQYIREVIQDSQDNATAGWVAVKSTSSDVLELSYKMCPQEGNLVSSQFPPRLWRCRADVTGVRPPQILSQLLHEQHLWDDHVTRWRISRKIDEHMDVFHHVTSGDVSTASTHPTVDFYQLRSWRTDLGGDCNVLVSFSVQEKPLIGCLRGHVHQSHFFVEPRGCNDCRVTYFSRVDIRGRSVEWYRKFYGHVCAYRLSRLCHFVRTAAQSATRSTKNSSVN